MSDTHPHSSSNEKPLFLKVVRACLVPACWLLLGAICYIYKTDLSQKAGWAFIFIGLVSLVYNLLRVRKAHTDKKKSLHL